MTPAMQGEWIGRNTHTKCLLSAKKRLDCTASRIGPMLQRFSPCSCIAGGPDGGGALRHKTIRFREFGCSLLSRAASALQEQKLRSGRMHACMCSGQQFKTYRAADIAGSPLSSRAAIYAAKCMMRATKDCDCERPSARSVFLRNLCDSC